MRWRKGQEECCRACDWFFRGCHDGMVMMRYMKLFFFLYRRICLEVKVGFLGPGLTKCYSKGFLKLLNVISC